MKIRKFDRYCELLDKCLEKVQKAKRDGVILTDCELLDYYFKYSMVTGKTRRGDIGFLASFYAEYLEAIFDFRTDGYTNKGMLDFLKRVCFRGRVNGISSIKVSGRDENGIFYLSVKNRRTKDYYELEVSDLRSFTQACIGVVTLVATDGLKDGEYKTFAEDYLLNVYKEIASGREPKPYIYDGVSKSFRAYVSRANATGTNGNIIQFKVG